MLLRRCVWNEAHELPRILGYAKEKDVPEIRGFTDGVCKDCVKILKAQWRRERDGSLAGDKNEDVQ